MRSSQRTSKENGAPRSSPDAPASVPSCWSITAFPACVIPPQMNHQPCNVFGGETTLYTIHLSAFFAYDCRKRHCFCALFLCAAFSRGYFAAAPFDFVPLRAAAGPPLPKGPPPKIGEPLFWGPPLPAYGCATNQNVLPLPGSLSTPKAKPCCTKMAFVMERPRPVPVLPASARAR